MKKTLVICKIGFIVLTITGLVVIQSCKKDKNPPTLTTTTISNITTSTASSGGTITSDGGAEVTTRGVCWGTSTQPTVTGSKTSDGTGTGSFSSSLSGLTENTTFYVRAYAVNSVGTSYGNEVTFKTNQTVTATITTSAVTSVTSTSAVSGGNISDDGGGSITARGVCWDIAENPTITNSKTSDGAGSGTFTSNITGLTPGTVNHVRAYATNIAGTAYGSDVSFTASAITATLTTATVTGISLNSASSGGNITSDGGSAITSRGVCWSTSENPLATGSHTSDGTGSGSFTSSITGLSPATAYYVRAYATNSAGTAYGNVLTFTTSSVTLPLLTTTTPSSITSTTAVSGGTISSDGGASVTSKGVCWSTSPNPTTSNNKTSDGTGTGAFTSTLTGLQPGVTYHVRAYAVNSSGTAYGNDLSFATLAVLPAVQTSPVISIGINTASGGGNVTSSGGVTLTAKGVCWSTSSNPTTSDSFTNDGTSAGAYTSSITGLTPGTIYYLRAYATNSVGTTYGSQVTFVTSVADVEGNIYKTVIIGTQVWFAENLKTTTYNDNSSIPLQTDSAQWKVLTTPAYCWYDNDEATYKNIAGAIYNWYTTNTGKLCPTGWRVASDDDFKTLEMYLGMSQSQADSVYWRGTDQGTQMKSTTGWSLSGNGTNSSGFNAVPFGYRFYADGIFYDFGTTCSFLTSTEYTSDSFIFRNLNSSYTGVFRKDAPKNAGKYVRCIKD